MAAKGCDKLARLRALMVSKGLQGYIVPSEDCHGSEYLCAADQRRAYLSSFTGSAGTALVLPSVAYLFTDGRYHQQAANQLSRDWTLQKQGLEGVKTWQEFLADLKPEGGGRVGIDSQVLSVADYQSITESLTPAEGSSSSSSAADKHIKLEPVDGDNLIDLVWSSSRPARPKQPVLVHDAKFAGDTVQSKIEKIRAELKTEKAQGVVVAALDEVAWTLNLRGSDIPYNPVFFSYLFIPLSSPPTLFIDIDQLSSPAYDALMKADVRIEPYDSFFSFLEGVGKSLKDGEKVLVPSRTNYASFAALTAAKSTVLPSPIAKLKSIKNEVEVQGFRNSHLRDGVALCRYFSWLEETLQQGGKVREYDGSVELERLRSELDLFRGLSFTTISSTGANASVIHYSPDEENSPFIDVNSIYLCDSGAQFSDGTTDTTRTLHFGTPTAKEKEAYTRVLKGHIAIDTLVFPKGTTGHGTGHGVGSFLCVHEGPQGISSKKATDKVSLAVGMTVSNEPGYYEEKAFGIRIENVVVVQKADNLKWKFQEQEFLKFERVTMVPISTNLVEKNLLTVAELAWLNAYNEEVKSKVGPLLAKTGDERAQAWLEKECRPL